jgi:predicted CoA-binding protein
LAAYIDIPKLVTEAQMKNWIKDFDSWEVCDQVCNSLFNKTTYCYMYSFPLNCVSILKAQGGGASVVREKKIYQMAEDITTADHFAVLANAEKFKKHKHAWKVWRALKEFDCTVYPVAPNLDRLEGSKVYPGLLALKDKIDVIIPCLFPEMLTTMVQDTVVAGAKKIWFQNQTWTPELHEQCQSGGIMVIKGCVLVHKIYKTPLGYLNPCYWHGLTSAKVPGRKKSF